MSIFYFHSFPFILTCSLGLILSGVNGWNSTQWYQFVQPFIHEYHEKMVNVRAIVEDFNKTLEHIRDSYYKAANVAGDFKKPFEASLNKTFEKIAAVAVNTSTNVVTFVTNLTNMLNTTFKVHEKIVTVQKVINKTMDANFREPGKIREVAIKLREALVKTFRQVQPDNSPNNLTDRLIKFVDGFSKSMDGQYGEDWKSHLKNVSTEIGWSLYENFGEDLQRVLAAPNDDIKALFDNITKVIIKELNTNLGQTLDIAQTFLTDVTKPIGGKVDEGLDKIKVMLGKQPGFLTKLILAISLILILLFCLIPFVFIWYRRRYPSLTKDEIRFFLRGKGKDGENEELGVDGDGRQFPEEFKIPKNRITLVNLKGKGNFGLVYAATLSGKDKKEGESTVAVKIPKPYCTKEQFKSMLSELKVLCYVGNHDHVLKFVGACVEDIGRGMVYIATELCENGALQEFLRKAYNQLEGGSELVKSKPNLYELSRYAHEIAMGMDYLSSKKVIHGDLSTRNVLMDSNNVCKIGDFGLSRKLKDFQMLYEKKRQKDGPLELPWLWLAIETFQRLEFSTKSDVWSYGITLWEIYSLGGVPYSGMSSTKTVLAEVEGGFRMSAPPLSTDLIYEQMRSCWDEKPERRPTFNELAQFFASIRDMEYSRC